MPQQCGLQGQTVCHAGFGSGESLKKIYSRDLYQIDVKQTRQSAQLA